MYKLYDILFLFSGGNRSLTKNLLSQQQHLYMYTDLYKESTDDEKDDNHSISFNKKTNLFGPFKHMEKKATNIYLSVSIK